MSADADWKSGRRGNRHKESMNVRQALIRNRRTCRPDAKGETKSAESGKARVPMRGTGADESVVVMKRR